VRIATWNVNSLKARTDAVEKWLARAERERAAAVIGHDGSPDELERELAAGIRSGALDARIDAVRAHVRATVREKLLIANPGYLPAETRA